MTFQAFLLKFIVCLFFSTTTNGFVTSHFIERSLKSETTAFRSTSDSNHFDNDDERNNSKNRRLFVNGISLSLITSLGSSFPKPAFASSKSRTEGYKFQKLDNEWKSQLTERQYDVLRNGGTERPYTSILESEERAGIYSCAGCGTNLFDSKEKFHSGTGWPSFASALEGVETEKVNFLQSNLAGAEIRCATCGGHLGDVFNDGFLFVGTPAAVSGKRFCVDGTALVFRSQDGTAEKWYCCLRKVNNLRPWWSRCLIDSCFAIQYLQSHRCIGSLTPFPTTQMIPTLNYFLLFCGLLASSSAQIPTTTINGKLKNIDKTPFNTTTRITLNNDEYTTYSRIDGSFAIYDVPPGIHQLDIHSTTYHFGQIKIQLLEDNMDTPKCLEYAYPGAVKQVTKYPLVLYPHAKYEYFTKRKGFNIFGLLKSPMVLMMLFGGGLTFLMPKMMEGMDEEEKEIMRKQMKAQQDPTKMLSQMFTGAAPEDEGKSRKERRKKLKNK